MRDSHKIELLAPAANAEIAREAILHGEDAVYMGPPSHGARKSAANSIEDISRTEDFVHKFGAKVYATVNTIVYDHELKDVERLAWNLYRAGTDAVIVQDMALLRLDLPPIALHASTQCDTRTIEKARFLEDVGFSQIVLARELTLKEIADICESLTVPVETFIHGALCVSYSGRCHASQATCGRSANRGECAQICRLPFTLTDANGKILAKDRHLLSLKDFNASDRLEELLNAGVRSLKIEGRLKDASYVKNVVAYYRQRLDNIIEASDGRYERSSSGESTVSFTPQLDKSFNRGFTRYFLDNRRQTGISSPLTPKSMGEEIKDISSLNNGDGISFFNSKNEYEGVMVNGIRNGRILGNRPFVIPKGATIHRTLDCQWQKQLSRSTAERKLWLDITLEPNRLTAIDERGTMASVNLDAEIEPAKSEQNLRKQIDKFGNTIYKLRDFKTSLPGNVFIPASKLSDARRRLIEAMETTAAATYEYDRRRMENVEVVYPSTCLDYQDNVANSFARDFYKSHGVKEISPAMETEKKPDTRRRSVMTTRHCILRENGRCLRKTPAGKMDFKLPLTLSSGRNRFLLEFDCRRCEMHLLHSSDAID